MTKILLSVLTACLFLLTGGIIYAHVYDIEPISPEKQYCLEREVFNRTNDNWAREFPNYPDWLEQNDQREQRMHEWIGNLVDRTGVEFAQIFDPSAKSIYPGSNTDYSAAAPENPTRGERE